MSKSQDYQKIIRHYRDERGWPVASSITRCATSLTSGRSFAFFAGFCFFAISLR